MSYSDTPEPTPLKNDGTPVWELVVRDMISRDHMGRQKYGTPLQHFNGRKPTVDAYQEALDLSVYLRQMIDEMDVYIHLADACVLLAKAISPNQQRAAILFIRDILKEMGK